MRFTEIVGLDTVKQALLLLAVDPGLGGCIMSAPTGSGKSALARAFRAVLPANAPFVELPVNVSEDRLIGGLDLETTLATGARALQHGLLAQAHGGVLYADGINLLDASVETALIETLSRGEVCIERDGLSARCPAKFMLLGTYDLREGELRFGLLDRVGLIAPFTQMSDPQARAEVVRRNQTVLHDGEDELELLRALVVEGRRALVTVKLADAQVQTLVKLALSLGVEGNRADIFAARAAVANAALNGRDAVDDDDLQLAAKLVLLPRATRLPEEQQAETEQTASPPQPEEHAPAEDTPEDRKTPAAQTVPEEMLFALLAADLPVNVLDLPFAQARRSRSGSRGAALNLRRGKFVRAVPGSAHDGRIAVMHTLLAAAPWQNARQSKCASSNASARIQLTAADLRLKRYRDKAGTLYVFAVDASGSMALNRMREAKGAAAKLLQTAYVHRDQVALVAFRGRAAQVLLPPSTSVDRAKRELDVLPTGGATPLASALLTSWHLIKQARSRGVQQSSLVLMTDGRGNTALNAEAQPDKNTINHEIEQLAALLRADGVKSVVIDTQASYTSRGEAPKLAQQLGGRYVYLPNARAEQIAAQVGGYSA